jgi:hypothetical protein
MKAPCTGSRWLQARDGDGCRLEMLIATCSRSRWLPSRDVYGFEMAMAMATRSGRRWLKKAMAREGDGSRWRWLQTRDGYRLERVMAPDDSYTLYRDDGYGRKTMATSTIWWL